MAVAVWERTAATFPVAQAESVRTGPMAGRGRTAKAFPAGEAAAAPGVVMATMVVRGSMPTIRSPRLPKVAPEALAATILARMELPGGGEPDSAGGGGGGGAHGLLGGFAGGVNAGLLEGG